MGNVDLEGDVKGATKPGGLDKVCWLFCTNGLNSLWHSKNEYNTMFASLHYI